MPVSHKPRPLGVASATGAADPPSRSFDAVDVRAIEAWSTSARIGSELRSTVGAPAKVREVYYDTDDWRIHRAGLTLRLRQTGHRRGPAEAVLEPLASDGGEGKKSSTSLSRVTQTLPAFDPAALQKGAGPVTARLLALVGTRPIDVRFELQAETTPVSVSLDGAPLVLVHLSHVTIPLVESQRPAHLDRVTVEAPSGWSRDAERLVEAMRLSFGLRPTEASWYPAALRALGLSPPGPADLGPTTIDRSTAVGEVAMVVLRRQFAKMLAHEPGTRLGEDPEELHDMRVAIRRMRAAFKLFRPYLPARALPLRAELTWIARVLGEVRDLDVQIAGVHSWADQLEPVDRQAIEGLLGPLTEHRDAARRHMIRALDSKRFERLVQRMSATLVRGPLRSEPSHRAPILAVAPQLIDVCHRRVTKSSRRLKKSSPAEAFHRARIQFKAFRYALEFHRDVYGKAGDDVIKTLVGLQDLLGDHQDADVATAWLRDIVTTEGRGLPPETLFVAGKVAERYARRARGLRRRFPRAYAKLRGRSWTRLVREMKELGEPYSDLQPVVRRPRKPAPDPERAPLPIVVDWRSRQAAGRRPSPRSTDRAARTRR